MGLGRKIDQTFLDILELGFGAIFLPIETKEVVLGRIITKIDVLKCLLQLAWENKLIHTNKYAELIAGTEEIGRMFGGWRRGLRNKTPAKWAGERPE